MKNAIVTLSMFTTVSFASLPARADLIGALAGGGAGLLIAGPPGAVAGLFIGGFGGRPFWGRRGLVGPMTHSTGIVSCQKRPPACDTPVTMTGLGGLSAGY